MTTREVYDYILIESNKVEAPSLLLESFNYLFGKAINETCNQWYTFYEQNQLITDNLRVLTRSTVLTRANLTPPLPGNFYQLPLDYWHLLPGSKVKFSAVGCTTGDIYYPAIKLDSQMYSGIERDYYTRPSYKRPYLFMHEFLNTVTPLSGPPVTTTYGIEIKCGSEIPLELKIDYLRKPKLPNKTLKEGVTVNGSVITPADSTNLYLTQDEIDSDTDISPTLEFPENYCYEIVNKLTALVLEQTGDPRLQNNMPLNQTMVPPRQG